AEIPCTVVPVAASARSEVVEVAFGALPHPHARSGEPEMGKVKCCGEGHAVLRIECGNVPVEHVECCRFGAVRHDCRLLAHLENLPRNRSSTPPVHPASMKPADT